MPSGSGSSGSGARTWRRSVARPRSCRPCPAASTSARCYDLAEALTEQGVAHDPEPAPGAAPRQPPPLDVDALLDDPATRIIVCCGSGGVGKTTTAAALALRAAERGRRVVVLTIDPARRLAQSMGLAELDNTPARCAASTGRRGGRSTR